MEYNKDVLHEQDTDKLMLCLVTACDQVREQSAFAKLILQELEERGVTGDELTQQVAAMQTYIKENLR